jgi:hypothetical protein
VRNNHHDSSETDQHHNHSDQPRAAASPPSEPAEIGAWDQIKQQVAELLEYAAYYLEAKTDILKFRSRQLLFRVQLRIAAILVISGAFVLAITLIFIGISQGLSQLFADKPWLGPLLTGLALLLIVSLGTGGWILITRRAAQHRMMQKYEHRKINQQARFRHDVAERAAARKATD